MNQRTSKPQNKYICISVLFCVCFLAGSILFVSKMMNENENDNRQFINNAAKQIQVSLSKQIQGGFQTLEGISITIGQSGDIDSASFLKASSCNLVQGYIFSKPLPQSEFEKMLHYHRNHPIPLSK